MLVGTAAAGGPARAQTPAAPPPPGVDPRVYVIGDSVMLGAHDALVAELAGWSVTVWAEEGLSTLGAASIVSASHAVIGDVVVVALGNNDAGDPTTFGQRIDGVMQAIGTVPRVIWVNLRNFASWVPAMDQQLVLAQSRWPNLQIADWNSVASPNPGFVYGDGLHLTPAGQTAMAQLVGQQIDAFVQSRSPASTTTTTTPTGPARRGPARRRHGHPTPPRYWPTLFGFG